VGASHGKRGQYHGRVSGGSVGPLRDNGRCAQNQKVNQKVNATVLAVLGLIHVDDPSDV